MKIRNRLLILCAIIALCCVGLIFAGCNAEENYTEWVTLTLPTCETSGVQVRTSADNPEVKQTRDIPATGHIWGEWETETEPTCSVEGVEKRLCAHCGNIDKRSIPAAEHVWDEWEVLLNPTCLTDGSMKRVCLNDETHTQLQNVPATGHDFSDWVTTLAPACTDNGVEMRYCRNDNAHVEARSVQSLGHKWGEFALVEVPTCTTEGLKISVCENDCEHVMRQTVTRLGHYFGEWVTSKPATETEEGEELRICKHDCTHVQTRTTATKAGEYLTFLQTDGGYKVRNSSTDNCPSTVYIPASYNGQPVTGLDSSAFTGCKNLERVVFLGNNLRVVGSGAFMRCINLQSVDLPEGVTTLGSALFAFCDSLKSVTIPSTVTKIGFQTQRGMTNFETLTVDPNNSVYKSDGNCLIERENNTLVCAFGNAQIPDYVVNIARNAFNVSSMESIVIPASVQNIDSSAFIHCNKLNTVTFVGLSVTLNKYAFSDCGNLIRVELPQGFGEIPENAFWSCPNMQTVIIPE